MRQLTGMDASFLYAETPRAHMAIGWISIYDPSTAPGGKVTFKGILEHIEQRLHEARVFRQRLVRVPFDLDHPYWIEDPDFDLEFHVRHIALPSRATGGSCASRSPGWSPARSTSTGRCGRCTSSRVSTTSTASRKGSFAVVSKVHHAAIDGMSGMEMTAAIHDITPEPAELLQW